MSEAIDNRSGIFNLDELGDRKSWGALQHSLFHW